MRLIESGREAGGAGWLARLPITFITVSGSVLTWKEKALVMLAWTPKASVQAALASAPLDRIIVGPLPAETVPWGSPSSSGEHPLPP